jgi:hypothetical protein
MTFLLFNQAVLPPGFQAFTGLDDDEAADVYIHSAVKKDGMRVSKTAFTRCAPRSTPLQPSLRLNRSLPMISRRDYPLTSPSRALGPLVIVTSLIGSTAGPCKELSLLLRHVKQLLRCAQGQLGPGAGPHSRRSGLLTHGSG